MILVLPQKLVFKPFQKWKLTLPFPKTLHLNQLHSLRKKTFMQTGFLKFDDDTFRGHDSCEKFFFSQQNWELFVVKYRILQMFQIYLEKIWNIKIYFMTNFGAIEPFSAIKGVENFKKIYAKIQKCFSNLMFDLFKIQKENILQISTYFICNLFLVFSWKSEVFTLLVLLLHPKAHWCRRVWTGVKKASFCFLFVLDVHQT